MYPPALDLELLFIDGYHLLVPFRIIYCVLDRLDPDLVLLGIITLELENTTQPCDVQTIY